MSKLFKHAALSFLAPALVLGATPALADRGGHRGADHGWHHGEHKRDRWERRQDTRYRTFERRDYRNDYRQSYPRNYRNTAYAEPVYANTRTWRGDDGRYYCRRSNGTTGLIVGGVAGALLGREVAGSRGDRTLGAILGAAGGALLGREVDRGASRSSYSCR